MRPRYLDPSPSRIKESKNKSDDSRSPSPVKKTKKTTPVKSTGFGRASRSPKKTKTKKSKPATAAKARDKTPPGKKRVAFRGQYVFVTDDEYESGSDKEDSDKYSSDDGKKSVVSKV